jgi:taurine dioxygenase
MGFAERFGEMEIHEVFTPLENHAEISVLVHDAKHSPISDSWHSDVTYRTEPSMACVLYARSIPPNGGDTLWLSATAAYKKLTEPNEDDARRLNRRTRFSAGLRPLLS